MYNYAYMHSVYLSIYVIYKYVYVLLPAISVHMVLHLQIIIYIHTYIYIYKYTHVLNMWWMGSHHIEIWSWLYGHGMPHQKWLNSALGFTLAIYWQESRPCPVPHSCDLLGGFVGLIPQIPKIIQVIGYFWAWNYGIWGLFGKAALWVPNSPVVQHNN